jgi:hypothetical protein
MRLFPLRFHGLRVGPRTVLACWVTCLVAGFAAAFEYASVAGPPVHAPQRVDSVLLDAAAPLGGWPANECRLLVFVHPQCPCTRATIEELDRIVAHVGSHAAIRVYVLADPARDAAWTKSDLWRAARRIPGVDVVADVRGKLARAFGVETSGTTVCYSPAGERRFQGGITGARGHAGDNAGADAVVAALLGEPMRVCEAPTFGCPMFDDLSDAAGDDCKNGDRGP